VMLEWPNRSCTTSAGSSSPLTLAVTFRKQALDLGVTVIEIDRKPLEAALTGLYTKIQKDSDSRHLVESVQKDQ
jgi:hypothetical protein